MTPGVFDFVRSLGLTGKTLEIGSRDINGSVRRLFKDYIGVDMLSGRNVDKVINGHNLPWEDESFDNVLCLETLEHDDRFWDTVGEMRRLVKPGGRMVITVPSRLHSIHAYPNDYWRFTAEGVKTFYEGMEQIHIDEKELAIYSCGTKQK